jgi:phosphoglycerol transferase MdoB-like AlkP superfamily enzyme
MGKLIQSVAQRLRRTGMSPVLVYAVLWALWLMGVMSAARVVFWYWFRQGNQVIDSGAFLQSLLLGLRFDLRLAILAVLPMLLFAAVPWVSRRAGLFVLPRAWLLYAALVWAVAGLFFIFDFGHFAYLQLRLNASVLNFFQDAATSRSMLSETYAVGPIALALLLFVAAMLWLQSRLLRLCAALPPWQRMHWGKKGVAGFCTGLILLLGIHGKFSQYPLRWSDAFASGNPFAAAVALNPVLNFFDTLGFKQADFDEKAVREAYPQMAQYLGVSKPDSAKLNFRREVPPKPGALAGKPNVVLVLLESFSAYKTTVFNNPLGPTPRFADMARNGVLFTHFFTAHSGTARGIFATLTGIPDVAVADTSSRNPLSVDQHMIINSFTDYEKFYFMGGSTTWANVRGVLKNNIEGLHLYEEDNFSAPHNDVWGISDKNLFLESNKVLREQSKPFFAVIQTAGNHRPYTIPAEDTDFKLSEIGEDKLKPNGFFANDEFNAFRYMDYSIGKFIDAAKQEKYFDNTVFVFLGDHGITGNGGAHMPPAWTDLRLTTGHTPFLLYAPKLLPPARHEQPGQQVDVLPTVAGLFNRPYVNTTLGRDLLDPQFDGKRNSFIIYLSEGPQISLLDREHYLTMQADGSKPKLYDIQAKKPLDTPLQDEQKTKINQMLTKSIYETARYMLTHNHKEANK